jgi:hypothetical protein
MPAKTEFKNGTIMPMKMPLKCAKYSYKMTFALLSVFKGWLKKITIQLCKKWTNRILGDTTQTYLYLFFVTLSKEGRITVTLNVIVTGILVCIFAANFVNVNNALGTKKFYIICHWVALGNQLAQRRVL